MMLASGSSHRGIVLVPLINITLITTVQVCENTNCSVAMQHWDTHPHPSHSNITQPLSRLTNILILVQNRNRGSAE